MMRRPHAAHPPSIHRQRGVSLIEMVMVFVILAVLVATVTPGIADQIRNSQLRNAAETVQKGLQQARAEAISRNQEVQFSMVNNLGGDCALSSSSGTWVISLSDPTGNCDSEASMSVEPRIVATHDFRDGNTSASVAGLKADGTPANVVIFNGTGRPKSTTQLARVNVQNGTTAADAAKYRQYRVVVNAAGGVRMCDVGVTDTNDPRRCPS